MTEVTEDPSTQWRSRAAKLNPETRLFIDGNFVEAGAGGTFATVNPATEKVIAQMAKGTAKDVDRAVKGGA
jgi:gamma-glutamyl-gamma-aminobutyraldehyde dehydrogenase